MQALPEPGVIVDGRYRTDAILGEGGMGRVYRAWDLTRDVGVALKVLATGHEADVARFEREQEISARLGALEGVVRVHAAGEWRGLHYFVTELVEGRDLSAVWREEVPLEDVVGVVVAVARTLERCHQRGVVHRDLKPANVLLTAEGEVRLIDFGLAKEQGAIQRLTLTGELLGTPGYMAPEQAEPSLGAVGPSTDVYGLGAILYQGLTGRPPFVGGVMEVLNAVVSRPPLRPSSLRSDVSAGPEEVCLKALSKAPRDRHSSAAEFAERLECSLAVRSSSVRRWLLGLLILACVCAVSSLVVAWPGWAAERALQAARELDGGACATDPGSCAGGSHRLLHWKLGLGEGVAPTETELDQALADLDRAAEGVEQKALRERLLAHRVLLGHLTNERVILPSNLGPSGEQVAALILSARGLSQEAFGRLPPKDRDPLVVRELLGLELVGRGLRAVLEEAPRASGSVSEDLLAVVAAGEALDLESAALKARIRRAKFAGLKSTKAAWLRTQPRRLSLVLALSWLKRIGAVAKLGGDGLEGVVDLIHSLEAPFVSAVQEGSSRAADDLLRVDNAVMLDVSPAWRPPPAVREVVVDSRGRPGSDPQRFLASLRADFVDSSLGRRLGSDPQQVLQRKHPESQVIRFWGLRVLSYLQPDLRQRDFDEFIRRGMAVLAARDKDLPERLFSEVYLGLSKAWLHRSKTSLADLEEQIRCAARAISFAEIPLAEPDGLKPEDLGDLYESLAFASFLHEPERPQRSLAVLAEARGAFEVRMKRNKENLHLKRVAASVWNISARYVSFTTDWKASLRLSNRALLLAGATRQRFLARANIARALLRLGDPAAAARAFGEAKTEAMREFETFAVVSVEVALANNDPALALKRAEQAKRLHQKSPAIHAVYSDRRVQAQRAARER